MLLLLLIQLSDLESFVQLTIPEPLSVSLVQAVGTGGGLSTPHAIFHDGYLKVDIALQGVCTLYLFADMAREMI